MLAEYMDLRSGQPEYITVYRNSEILLYKQDEEQKMVVMNDEPSNSIACSMRILETLRLLTRKNELQLFTELSKVRPIKCTQFRRSE
jgi:hypothetical protein